MELAKTNVAELLIGAHTSAAGGAFQALLEGQRIGATTIQFFTANQKRWTSKPLDQAAIDLYKDTLKETGIKKVMSHDSYLINLGSPSPENLEKSLVAFRQEIERCKQLEVTFLNFHPGAALKSDPQQCLDLISDSLLQMQDLLEDGRLRLLLEATAGQGSCVGYTFEQLAYIKDKVHGKLPIGVCIDTCHIFAAGYDLRTAEACDKTISEFDAVVGLEHLYAFHLNDSLKGLGSRVDRHAPLGEGLIGLECFRFLMTDPRTRDLPMYLETPEGPSLWEKEIRMLRDLANI
ncbi:MAG TPA: deoxyribonuclease IV [Parachlamydiaceae bacterium]|nr:deoxyribonuclease IV [Parachlamydiaceae bacterium]